MTMQNIPLAAMLLLLVPLTARQSRGDDGPAEPKPNALGAIQLPKDAMVITGRSGIPRMGELLPSGSKQEVSAETSKGISQSVYPKIAPSVVVVKLPGGHGTGFVIDGDGWIITNNHVAVAGAPNPNTGALTAQIIFGHMEGKWMKLGPAPVAAQVYKVSPELDLALLKVGLANPSVRSDGEGRAGAGQRLRGDRQPERARSRGQGDSTLRQYGWDVTGRKALSDASRCPNLGIFLGADAFFCNCRDREP